jgi:hypothetical protein
MLKNLVAAISMAGNVLSRLAIKEIATPKATKA